MKIATVILFAFLGMLFPKEAEEEITLKVKITNVANEDSNIMIAVFRSYDTFLTENMYRKEVVAVDDFTETEIEFKLVRGEYGIAVFQDKNKNGDLDRNFFSYPLEPFGFSRNFRPLIKAPHWTDVAFQINEPSSIEVRLN
jgi:uncharacterized protein (DUF2141 family)